MSKIYSTEEEAKKDYNEFVALHKRQQCELTFFEVDHCYWEEGFVTLSENIFAEQNLD